MRLYVKATSHLLLLVILKKIYEEIYHKRNEQSENLSSSQHGNMLSRQKMS